MVRSREEKGIGLALSGGGCRSVAHLGMMQALIEQGVSFSQVAGSSAGVIIGALYCRGISPKEILKILSALNYLSIFRPALNWQALLNLEKVIDFLTIHLPEDDFSSLNIPLVVVATDLNKGKIKYFKKGQLWRPLIASCSIPVVFSPVKIKGTAYVDGGLLNNLPIEPLKKKYNYVIGLHCNPIGIIRTRVNWKKQLERSWLLAISSRDRLKIKKIDLFWEPPELSSYHVFNFKRLDTIFEIGYDYALQQLRKGKSEFLINSYVRN
ncbi:patatin-like phospholipase family protein [Cyclobacteriaceae bacterium]|nr:patatin-like phospholipase family protein [Cyclobacteriaceae bacterium]